MEDISLGSNAKMPGNLKTLSMHTETIVEARRSLGMALDALSKFETFRVTQPPNVKEGISFYDEVKRFELAIICNALRETRGSQRRAASLLGLKNTTLNAKIKAYRIDWRDYK